MNNLEIKLCPETFNNIVKSIADRINLDDLADHIDPENLVSNLHINAADVAENMHTHEIADCIDVCDVASYLNTDEIAEEVLNHINYKKLASNLLAILLENKSGLPT